MGPPRTIPNRDIIFDPIVAESHRRGRAIWLSDKAERRLENYPHQKNFRTPAKRRWMSCED
jgi:hypothetical protein